MDYNEDSGYRIKHTDNPDKMPPPEQEVLERLAVLLKLFHKGLPGAITLAQEFLQLQVIFNIPYQKYPY
jgi:hypothetical protein